MIQCLDLFKCVSNHEPLVENYVARVGNQVVWGPNIKEILIV